MLYHLFSIETTSTTKCIITHEKLTHIELCKVLSASLLRVSRNEFKMIERQRKGKEQIKFYIEEEEIKVESTVDIWNTIYVISEFISNFIIIT